MTMIDDIEQRLHQAGAGGSAGGAAGPDPHQFRRRAAVRQQRRRVAATTGLVAVVAAGIGAGLLSGRGAAVIEAGTFDSSPADTSIPVDGTTDDGTTGDGTTGDGAVPATVSPDPGEAGAGAAGGGAGATGDPATTVQRPRPDDGRAAVADGLGGWLAADGADLIQFRADGTEVPIVLPVTPGSTPQRWLTDVAVLDGRPWAFVNEFVDRSDLAAERVDELLARYGLPPAGEGTDVYSELDGVATAEELDNLVHFEVSIYAVDLTTGEVATVERRVINRITAPEWMYNAHVTSDGQRVLVMRELWQGQCYFAAALALDGTPLAWPDNPAPPPPGYLDLSFDQVQAIQSNEARLPGCNQMALDEQRIRAVIGVRADPDDLAAVNADLVG